MKINNEYICFCKILKRALRTSILYCRLSDFKIRLQNLKAKNRLSNYKFHFLPFSSKSSLNWKQFVPFQFQSGIPNWISTTPELSGKVLTKAETTAKKNKYIGG